MSTQFKTSSAKETKELAKTLVKKWMRQPRSKGAFVVGFEGELGSGKTTFIQGAVEALGIKEKVTSPTFVLMKRYQTPDSRNLYHIDCYRLNTPKELLSLGWRELLRHPENIVFVEWADRFADLMPPKTVHMKFQASSPRKRLILVSYGR